MRIIVSILVAVFVLSGCNTNKDPVISDNQTESSITQDNIELPSSTNPSASNSGKEESSIISSEDSSTPSSSGAESPSNVNEESSASVIDAEDRPVEQKYFDFVYGKYVCAGEKFSEDHFIRFPEDIPYVTFYKNGSCEVSVNYMQGLCLVSGTFSIEGNQIFVELNFDGTMYEGTGTKYMDDKYVFSNVRSGQIIIDRDCYFVNAGDLFRLEES